MTPSAAAQTSGTSALVVVDVQVDFCEGGALGVEGGTAVAEQLAGWLAQGTGHDHVVATRDHHIDPGAHFSSTPDFIDSWPPHCVVGTAGQELHPALSAAGFEQVFDKGSYQAAYSGFEGTAGPDGPLLGDWLSSAGVTRVDVVGIASDYCVKATALDAARLGFEVRVLLDLTAAVHPDQVAAVSAQLTTAGIQVVGAAL